MNDEMQNFSFELVTIKEQPLIIEWLHKSHVKPYFFGVGLENTLNSLEKQVNGEKANFQGWIAHYKGEPMGYLMTSDVGQNDKPYSKYNSTGKAITLDLLIGEEKFLGKSLSHIMIQAFVKNKFSQIDRVFIDPATENAKAIHVYKKAGFKELEEFIPTWYPVPHLLLLFEL